MFRSIELDVWLSADNEIVISHRDSIYDNDTLYASLCPDEATGKTPTVGEYKVSDREKYKVKEAWLVIIFPFSYYSYFRLFFCLL